MEISANLDFDILVGVDDKKGTSGKGELKVAGIFSIGGGIDDENLTKTHNRIKFTVPVAFSTSPTPKKTKRRRVNASNLR